MAFPAYPQPDFIDTRPLLPDVDFIEILRSYLSICVKKRSVAGDALSTVDPGVIPAEAGQYEAAVAIGGRARDGGPCRVRMHIQ
jgi:hypothetical protein